MANINGYCPHCKADLDGALIIETYLSLGFSEEKALEWASSYSGYEENGKQNKWGRQIGLSSIEKDREIGWKCPDCNNTWSR